MPPKSRPRKVTDLTLTDGDPTPDAEKAYLPEGRAAIKVRWLGLHLETTTQGDTKLGDAVAYSVTVVPGAAVAYGVGYIGFDHWIQLGAFVLIYPFLVWALIFRSPKSESS